MEGESIERGRERAKTEGRWGGKALRGRAEAGSHRNKRRWKGKT